MKSIVTLLVAAFLLLAGCATPGRQHAPETSDAEGLGALAWLAGSWVHVNGATVSEEHWTPPRGRLMLGVNRVVRNGRDAHFEHLRIEQRDDGVYYLASPQGRCPPTPFRLKLVAGRRVVFENPEHDFPQRIEYVLDSAGELHAAVEGETEGVTRRSEWSWRRVTDASAWAD